MLEVSADNSNSGQKPMQSISALPVKGLAAATLPQSKRNIGTAVGLNI